MLRRSYLSVPCYKEFPVATYIPMLQFLKGHCLQGRAKETNYLSRIMLVVKTFLPNHGTGLSIVGDFLYISTKALSLGFSLGKIQEELNFKSVQTIFLLFFSKTSTELWNFPPLVQGKACTSLPKENFAQK